MSVVGWFKGNGPTGFGYNSTAEQVTDGLDLSGKTYALTGCNSGLGQETMRVLGLRGARVIALARTVQKAQDAARGMDAEILPVACDLSEPDSVRAAVARVHEIGHPLDGIIANAGIMALPKLELSHGFERQFFTNHVGHFMLVTGLIDMLTDDGRVVMLSSLAHTNSYSEGIQFDNLDGSKGYTAWGAYGQSKLANLLFARELARRLGPNQRAWGVHPGVIATNLTRHMSAASVIAFTVAGPLFTKSVPQGAATQCFAATNPLALHIPSGSYLSDSNEKQSSSHGSDQQMAERLWTATEELVAGLG